MLQHRLDFGPDHAGSRELLTLASKRLCFIGVLSYDVCHTLQNKGFFFRNITPMLGEDRFFDEFSLRFLTTYHSHAAWRSFWPYFSFVLQRFFQEMLTPLEVFA